MGRQTHIIATLEDEQAFLRFLRDTADIAVFETFAPTIQKLWKNSFEEKKAGHFFYHIWNKAFPWTPDYQQLDSRSHDPKRIGWYYISNASAAPVIEFERSNFHPIRAGRLYWAKDFSAADGLDYDVAAFSKWYDSVIRWVRKHGHREESGTLVPYFLCDAWKRRKELAEPSGPAK